jgi:hypothetical protein
MRKSIFILFVFISPHLNAQLLAPYQGVQNQPKVEFDYWVYSTHAGNGSTSQYPSPLIQS